MKHILISTAALIALTGCGGSSSDGSSLADLAQKIETETNLDTLFELEATAASKVEEALAVHEKATVAVGSLFLSDNASKDGVITTASKLQYKVIQEGLENGASAAPGQGIAANYHGYFINGEVFDSSYTRGQPLTGPSNGFIKGWNEALGEMKVCEARTLYINSDLAYGDNGRGGIPGGATLLFNMQLLAVRKTDETDHVYECPEEKILSGPEAY